jgi:hypothetical protein
MPWGEHVMVFWNLLDGGLSHNGPLLGPSEFLRGGTLDTNLSQQPPSVWQVSICWVIWILLVCDKFVEYSILGTKYSGISLLSAFSPNWSNRRTYKCTCCPSFIEKNLGATFFYQKNWGEILIFFSILKGRVEKHRWRRLLPLIKKCEHAHSQFDPRIWLENGT